MDENGDRKRQGCAEKMHSKNSDSLSPVYGTIGQKLKSNQPISGIWIPALEILFQASRARQVTNQSKDNIRVRKVAGLVIPKNGVELVHKLLPGDLREKVLEEPCNG